MVQTALNADVKEAQRRWNDEVVVIKKELNDQIAETRTKYENELKAKMELQAKVQAQETEIAQLKKTLEEHEMTGVNLQEAKKKYHAVSLHFKKKKNYDVLRLPFCSPKNVLE
jgi:DNA mismatch repair ATPase MutS